MAIKAVLWRDLFSAGHQWPEEVRDQRQGDGSDRVGGFLPWSSEGSRKSKEGMGMGNTAEVE